MEVRSVARPALLSVLLGFAACGSGNTGSAGDGSTFSVLDGGTPSAGTGDHFIIDGTASKLSGKATITDFRRLKLNASFGIAPLVIPQDHVMHVEVEYKDYLPENGLTGAWGTDFVKQATATLNMPATSPIAMGVWTPAAPGGVTFKLDVKNKKVSLTWQGPVAKDGKSYQVDAVMTDVPVPF